MSNSYTSIKDDYLMVTYNPVLQSYEYQLYHVLDISKINGKTIVNVQYTNKDNLISRVSLSKTEFLNLILSKVLIPMQ